ncbi:MAG: squalene/phytoene synthase family protein [Geminicoccaceae bacterium]
MDPSQTGDAAPDDRSAYLLAEAKRRDPDRYLCALFAPAERRDDLLALLLFNDELARIPDAVTQPMTGLIRLQWWRDALDELLTGRPPRRHPVVEALAPLVADGRAAANTLHAMVDAREPALEQPAPGLDWLEGYAQATSGGLSRAWYTALGGRSQREAQGALSIGAAYGLLGLGEALQSESAPLETGAERLASLTADVRIRAAELCAEGRRLAGRPDRRLMAAFLPAALVDDRLAGRRSPHGRGPLAPVRLGLRAWLRRP